MKGQGALEYLMTYGWALLVIVVVGAALFALGVLNPQTYTQKRCVGFQEFVYQDQRLTETQFQISLINGKSSVTVTNVSITGDSSAGGDLGGLTLTGATNPVTPSKAFTATGTNDPTTKTSGDAYSYTVTVTYDVTSGIPGQTDQATCTGRVV